MVNGRAQDWSPSVGWLPLLHNDHESQSNWEQLRLAKNISDAGKEEVYLTCVCVCVSWGRRGLFFQFFLSVAIILLPFPLIVDFFVSQGRFSCFNFSPCQNE